MRAPLLALVLLAPQTVGVAGATWVDVPVEPTHRRFGVAAQDVDATNRTVETGERGFGENCVPNRILCVGPLQLKSFTLLDTGDRGYRLRSERSYVYVAFDENRYGEYGPYFLVTPAGTVPICQYECLFPTWANATVSSNWTLTHRQDGQTTQVSNLTIQANTTPMLAPYVRPYHEGYNGSEARYVRILS